VARQSYAFERVLLFATWSTAGGGADYRGLRLTLPGGCHGDSGSEHGGDGLGSHDLVTGCCTASAAASADVSDDTPKLRTFSAPRQTSAHAVIVLVLVS
jgi:hypothetical protein